MLTLAVMAAATLIQSTPRTYDACVDAVRTDTEAGRRYAEVWVTEGGGNPARHCNAVAMLAAGSGGAAGVTLRELAVAEETDPGVAARLYLQAAEAFMIVNRHDDAFAALRDAYRLAPDVPEVHMAAATVYATAKHWEGVILTINALERHAALSSDALALRGRAKFESGKLGEAAHDAGKALALDDLLVDALVLRGDLINAGMKVPVYEAPTDR